MNLGDLMSMRVATVGAHESVSAAAKVMREERTRCLVLSGTREIEGIITVHDLVVRCIGRGHAPQDHAIGEYQSAPVITAPASTELTAAALLMEANGISHLPVVEDHRLAGIVSAADVASAMAEPLQGLLAQAHAARARAS